MTRPTNDRYDGPGLDGDAREAAHVGQCECLTSFFIGAFFGSLALVVGLCACRMLS